jgi:hypothetical protein
MNGRDQFRRRAKSRGTTDAVVYDTVLDQFQQTIRSLRDLPADALRADDRDKVITALRDAGR